MPVFKGVRGGVWRLREEVAGVRGLCARGRVYLYVCVCGRVREWECVVARVSARLLVFPSSSAIMSTSTWNQAAVIRASAGFSVPQAFITGSK